MKYLIVAILSFFTLTSCITVKQVKYLDDSSKQSTSEAVKPSALQYKIQKGDQLYVKILSLDEKTYNFFNADAADYANINETKLYLTSYEVNDSGFIVLPMAGKIEVKGLSVEEARNKIQKIVDEYLNQSTVVVKLVSFKVTILGEVTRPGKYMVLNTQINIFEAIGNAGDITDYGNKKRVMLLRQTAEGMQTSYLNLQDKSILNNPNFYLQPNDVIYVEPLPAKSYGARSFTVGTMLSTLTTAFSAISTLIIFLNYVKN